MALIIMCCFDTEENDRTKYTHRTLESLLHTVNWKQHDLILVDNGSCEETKRTLSHYAKKMGGKVLTNTENIGTARAVNQGLALRNTGEYCIKLDNDVVVGCSGWVDELEAAIERSPEIGVLGLKRKDLIQTTWMEDPNYRSELVMLPHESGQSWIIVEKTFDVMGTCTMLNHRLLDRIGYYFQGGWQYGMDDTLLNLRCHLAGFSTCFLSHINIEHIDDGSSPYTQEKHKMASEVWGKYIDIHNEYQNGTRDIYYDGGF